MAIRKINVIGSGLAIGQSKTFTIDNLSFEAIESESNNKNAIAIDSIAGLTIDLIFSLYSLPKKYEISPKQPNKPYFRRKERW